MTHDQRFKTLLKEFFAEFIQLFFANWADRFDFSHVEWLEQEAFLDPPQGERRVMDLVAKLPARQPVMDRPGAAEHWIVLIHIEIEAAESVEPLRARMWDYYRQLRHRHKLPVLPIGLYLKVGLNGIGWDVYEEWFWEHRLVHFEYAYIGLPALDAVQYLEGDNWLGVALSVLMNVPAEQRAALKARAYQRVRASRENEYRRFLLAEVVEAYLPLEGPHLAEFEQLLRSKKYKGARKMYESTIDQIEARGSERGQRKLLTRQLQKRFGRLSAAVKARLAAWPAERLEELGDALLTAKSLQELGLEDSMGGQRSSSQKG